MELNLGVMKSKDIASWFGISYDTFRRTKKKRLEELSEYCRYEIVYGGIDIKSIEISEYIKKDSNYQIVKKNVDSHWDESGLDTKKNVAKKIYEDPEVKLEIAKTTTYNYTCKASNELYGSTRNPIVGGEIGNCWYVLCPINIETGKARLFTEEEQKKRKKLKTKYFSEKVSKEKIEETKEALYLQVLKGEIPEEEAKDTLYNIEKGPYLEYLEALEKILPTNEVLDYRTQKELYEQSAF